MLIQKFQYFLKDVYRITEFWSVGEPFIVNFYDSEISVVFAGIAQASVLPGILYRLSATQPHYSSKFELIAKHKEIKMFKLRYR